LKSSSARRIRPWPEAPTLKANIRLTLTVHVGPMNDRNTGDLDGFIAGVCEGLIVADPRSRLHLSWSDPALREVHPMKPLAIVDDSEVVSIKAEKIVGDCDEPWYEVLLEGDV